MTLRIHIASKIVCWLCETNWGRYIGDPGSSLAVGVVGTRIICSVCAIENKIDAIKIDDVPKLLAWCREVLAGGTMGGSAFQALREIVGVKP